MDLLSTGMALSELIIHTKQCIYAINHSVENRGAAQKHLEQLMGADIVWSVLTYLLNDPESTVEEKYYGALFMHNRLRFYWESTIINDARGSEILQYVTELLFCRHKDEPNLILLKLETCMSTMIIKLYNADHAGATKTVQSLIERVDLNSESVETASRIIHFFSNLAQELLGERSSTECQINSKFLSLFTQIYPRIVKIMSQILESGKLIADSSNNAVHGLLNNSIHCLKDWLAYGIPISDAIEALELSFIIFNCKIHQQDVAEMLDVAFSRANANDYTTTLRQFFSPVLNLKHSITNELMIIDSIVKITCAYLKDHTSMFINTLVSGDFDVWRDVKELYEFCLYLFSSLPHNIESSNDLNLLDVMIDLFESLDYYRMETEDLLAPHGDANDYYPLAASLLESLLGKLQFPGDSIGIQNWSSERLNFFKRTRIEYIDVIYSLCNFLGTNRLLDLLNKSLFSLLANSLSQKTCGSYEFNWIAAEIILYGTRTIIDFINNVNNVYPEVIRYLSILTIIIETYINYNEHMNNHLRHEILKSISSLRELISDPSVKVGILTEFIFTSLSSNTSSACECLHKLAITNPSMFLAHIKNNKLFFISIMRDLIMSQKSAEVKHIIAFYTHTINASDDISFIDLYYTEIIVNLISIITSNNNSDCSLVYIQLEYLSAAVVPFESTQNPIDVQKILSRLLKHEISRTIFQVWETCNGDKLIVNTVTSLLKLFIKRLNGLFVISVDVDLLIGRILMGIRQAPSVSLYELTERMLPLLEKQKCMYLFKTVSQLSCGSKSALEDKPIERPDLAKAYYSLVSEFLKQGTYQLCELQSEFNCIVLFALAGLKAGENYCYKAAIALLGNIINKLITSNTDSDIRAVEEIICHILKQLIAIDGAPFNLSLSNDMLVSAQSTNPAIFSHIFTKLITSKIIYKAVNSDPFGQNHKKSIFAKMYIAEISSRKKATLLSNFIKSAN